MNLVEFPLRTPATAEVVIQDFAGLDLADGGIRPIPQTHREALDLTAEEAMLARHRLSKLTTPAGGNHRRRIADFGLNPNNVGHDGSLCEWNRNSLDCTNDFVTTRPA